MTVVRITIKKKLTGDAYSFRQTASGAFSSEYLVESQASFPSPQLESCVRSIAHTESRLYPDCVLFDGAIVKLATPGASGEELRGQYSYVGLPGLRGQVEMGEDGALAYPPVAAVFARNASRGRYGRLLLPYALTMAEWNLYVQKRVRPLRFQNQRDLAQLGPTPALSFSQQLLEAVREAGGTYVLPSAAGEDEQQLRRVHEFVFMEFQAGSSKPKRRKAVKRRPSLAGTNEGADSAPRQKSAKARGKAREPVEGVVYLLQAGPHFKIGKSIDFDKRLGQIKLQLPYAVEVVHVMRAADPSQVESYWHRRFSPLRQNGEWFLLTQTEVDEFKGVSKM